MLVGDIERSKLVFWALLSPLSFLVLLASQEFGFEWNIHGVGAFVMMLILLIALVSFIREVSLVPSSIKLLVENHSLRNLNNIISVSLGVIYMLLFGTIALLAIVRRIWA